MNTSPSNGQSTTITGNELCDTSQGTKTGNKKMIMITRNPHVNKTSANLPNHRRGSRSIGIPSVSLNWTFDMAFSTQKVFIGHSIPLKRREQDRWRRWRNNTKRAGDVAQRNPRMSALTVKSGDCVSLRPRLFDVAFFRNLIFTSFTSFYRAWK